MMQPAVAPSPQRIVTTPPEAHADELPEGVTTLQEALVKLADVLPGLHRAVAELANVVPPLRNAVEHRAETMPRLAYRADELARALGVSRETLDRERAAGRVPKPDVYMGKMPLWRVETVRDWLAQPAAVRGGRRDKHRA